MHLHCHLFECITDYGPLHSFWCFAFERYNGILGSMPNNKRCIESQLMKRFLNESQLLSCSIPDDEFSQQLAPLLPKTKHTGSIADTMLATTVQARGDSLQKWKLDSLGSCIDLPKFSSRCVLDSRQQECIINLYSYIYSVSITEIYIAHTCSSYSSVTLGGKFFGTRAELQHHLLSLRSGIPTSLRGLVLPYLNYEPPESINFISILSISKTKSKSICLLPCHFIKLTLKVCHLVNLHLCGIMIYLNTVA